MVDLPSTSSPMTMDGRLDVVRQEAPYDGGQAAEQAIRAEFDARLSRYPHWLHHFFTTDGPFDLVPEGGVVERSFMCHPGFCLLLVGGPDWCGLIEHLVLEGSCRVTFGAPSQEAARRLSDQVAERVPPEAAPEPGMVYVRFWSGFDSGISKSVRRVRCPTWDDIAANYPREVWDSLAGTIHSDPPGEFDGRLAIWHGPPGTGKTSAVRALIRAWRPWAHVEYVTDWGRFFSDPEYASEVALRPGDRRRGEGFDSGSYWRAVLVEDADLSALSEPGHSDGLSKLLGLTDGILGQGSRVMFVITTNQRVERLPPALIRPGRMFSEIAFRPFRPTEAEEWLGAPPPVRRPEYTLADLYAIRAGRPGRRIHAAESGQYL